VAKTVEDVKCNMDAEMFPQQHGFGIGLCICNDKGEFLKSKTLHRNHVLLPKEAEAMGLKEALLWLLYEKFQPLPLNAVVFNCKDFKYCSVLYFWISFGSLHTLCLGYFMLKVLNLMDSNLVMVDFSRNLLARILVLVAIT
jgi:hypothetical protein